MRIAYLLAAVVTLLALTPASAIADGGPPTMVDYPAAQRSALQDQAAANNLSPEQARALQQRVDQVIARTDGAQVAINQVAWDGGDTLIPLPGERRARDLGTAPKSAVHGCHYTQFCTYQLSDFTGMMDRMSSCGWHVTHAWPYQRLAAYVNNQTPGTVARFYYANRKPLSRTFPAPAHGAVAYQVAYWTKYIRPC